MLNLSDEELMVRYQQEDFAAFEILYARLAPRVYAYFRKRVQRAEAVEELFQMVFMKLHQTRHTYNAEFKVLPWLYTICRTTLADAARGRRILPHPAEESLSDRMEGVAVEAPEGQTLDLAGLDEAQETVVRLHLEEDLPFHEIAERLSLKPDAVRQRFSRAIRKLRKAWAQKGGE